MPKTQERSSQSSLWPRRVPRLILVLLLKPASVHPQDSTVSGTRLAIALTVLPPYHL
jgi:hypothetical protein